MWLPCAANARLRGVIEAKDTEVAVLRAQVEALAAEMEALRARLAASSRNSSRPPSSDGLARSAPRSLRGKSGRRPGRPKGQPGAGDDRHAGCRGPGTGNQRHERRGPLGGC
ncbi:MAG: DUF6444 domain-containing protein [Streptosporangiaceae bacterium]